LADRVFPICRLSTQAAVATTVIGTKQLNS
jgi:hypothetical protein